mmetsp:Transcript_106808/g.184241  ORF Transcript_106808/g.184241 Transcript_106808/m.184241 type:complete len:242 (+) Transcript_106808:342-1067(+)
MGEGHAGQPCAVVQGVDVDVGPVRDGHDQWPSKHPCGLKGEQAAVLGLAAVAGAATCAQLPDDGVGGRVDLHETVAPGERPHNIATGQDIRVPVVGGEVGGGGLPPPNVRRGPAVRVHRKPNQMGPVGVGQHALRLPFGGGAAAGGAQVRRVLQVVVVVVKDEEFRWAHLRDGVRVPEERGDLVAGDVGLPQGAGPADRPHHVPRLPVHLVERVQVPRIYVNAILVVVPVDRVDMGPVHSG